MVAPEVPSLMVTVCGEVYVPATGLKVGVAATPLIGTNSHCSALVLVQV
jgi:hypothetical protein